jgi:DNA polymerase (family 10)
MDKFEIARTLDEISRYLELSEPNRFKALAFERAARALRAQDRDAGELIASGALIETPGIGKATAAVIEELAREGRSRYLDELRAKFPPGIFELLRVPNLGLQKIRALHDELGVGSLDELEAAAKANRVASLRGFGAKTQQKILEGIERARKRESRFLLPIALEYAEAMRERLATVDEIEDAEVTGSVRRRLEVVRNVNIAVATRKAEAVIATLLKLVENGEVIEEGVVKGLINGEMEVFFHLSPPADFGGLLLRTTGSSEFVDEFIRAFGKIPRARKEAEVFKRAGHAYVPPERRESADDLRRKRARPLVTLDSLRGTFHVHTTFSDGRNTVHEMLAAARERGFEYVGLSDHSPAAYYAGGLSEERLRQQWREIDKVAPEVAPMRVFRGTEADILADGSIDYGGKVLAKFDFVIASIHSRFQMPKDEMTERMLRALDDPHVTFLGHITGRKLLSRDGYSVDFDRIFERCAARGVMIEINGNPNRLDLDWRHIPRALSFGVRFSINPDAHSIREYGALLTGTWVARKAGLGPKEIFNTRGADEVAEYLAERKKGAAGG